METNENQQIDGNKQAVPGYENVDAFLQNALRHILLATKASNELPEAGDEFAYYNSFQGFQTFTHKERASIIALMTTLVKSQGINYTFDGDVDEKFGLLNDINESFLENISNYLNEASGTQKPEENLIFASKSSVINTSWNKKFPEKRTTSRHTLLAGRNITRPQLKFKNKVDNTNSPFVPLIKEKPNSIKPLAIYVEKDGGKEQYCHPYEWELEKFSPPDEVLEMVEPIVPKTTEKTPLVIVKTSDELTAMCDELRHVKEFAVDLEHHSFRTFQGITCLMQISTRDKDYIIDVLEEVRSHLYILNEVFTDPKIVKVFHGADMDTMWLQRDFGLYVVNMFDTGQAARVLELSHLSLAYLLKYYCKRDVDKKFQLADWRIRPLPNEMVQYAREDTHYLLYIYDCIKNDLIKSGNSTKNLLCSTFERSKMICLKRYEKPIFTDKKYLDLYEKSRKVFNPKQLYCLKELFSWRDRIARENDESIGYVLPNHMMLQIAEALPREQQGLIACCNPVPIFVLQNLNELHMIVLRINNSPLKQLEFEEYRVSSQAQNSGYDIDLSSTIHCPHDILHSEHTPDVHIPAQTRNDKPSQEKPTLSVLFDTHPKQNSCISVSEALKKVKEVVKRLINPFQRFKVTEEYQSSQQQNTNHDVEMIQSNEDHMNTIASTSTASATRNVTSEPGTSRADTSCEISESIPIRKSRKKKKHKADPDVSFVPKEEKHQGPPKHGNSWTPEVNPFGDDFQPYDYSQTDLSSLSRRNNSKKARGSNHQQYKNRGKPYGKYREQFKQMTFTHQGSGSRPWNHSERNWPGNR